MIHAVFETDKRQRLVRAHRIFGNLGDQRDILIGGEARDQIVELKHKADMFAAIGRQPAIIERGQLKVLERKDVPLVA